MLSLEYGKCLQHLGNPSFPIVGKPGLEEGRAHPHSAPLSHPALLPSPLHVGSELHLRNEKPEPPVAPHSELVLLPNTREESPSAFCLHPSCQARKKRDPLSPRQLNKQVVTSTQTSSPEAATPPEDNPAAQHARLVATDRRPCVHARSAALPHPGVWFVPPFWGTAADFPPPSI